MSRGGESRFLRNDNHLILAHFDVGRIRLGAETHSVDARPAGTEWPAIFVVAVIQKDAIERKGLRQLLFEPETLGQVTPDVELVGTLILC